MDFKLEEIIIGGRNLKCSSIHKINKIKTNKFQFHTNYCFTFTKYQVQNIKLVANAMYLLRMKMGTREFEQKYIKNKHSDIS